MLRAKHTKAVIAVKHGTPDCASTMPHQAVAARARLLSALTVAARLRGTGCEQLQDCTQTRPCSWWYGNANGIHFSMSSCKTSVQVGSAF